MEILLKLDSLISPEKCEAIRKINPDQISADGETLLVEYGRDWSSFYALTNITEEFARRTKLEAITLPSGRQVKLVCGSHSAMTFHELVEKLEKSRIETAWEKVKAENEHRSWISNPAYVHPFLSELLTAIEITKDSKGEPIVGFFSLYSDSDPDFQIRIRENKEEAEKETAVGMERFLRKSCKEVLTVPQEEPYYTTGSWSSSLTEVGEALKSGLENLVEEKVEGLSSENISARVEEVKAEAERMKAEISDNFAKVKELIVKTEAEVNAKVETVNYDDREYVSSEISQAEEALKEAKNSLKKLAYEDAKIACELALPFVADLPRLVAERTVAREEAKAVKDEISSVLYDIYGRYDDYRDSTGDEQGRANEIRDEIDTAYSNRQYDKVLELVETARTFIAEVHDRQAKQAEEACAEIQRKQIPERLLVKKAFNGDYNMAYDFMQKVAALPTNRLDSHIVCNCGRARVQSHLIEVSGDPDFFMGADPNAVVFYVAEVHFYKSHQRSEFSDDTVSSSSSSSSGSLGSLGEALRKAGLVR